MPCALSTVRAEPFIDGDISTIIFERGKNWQMPELPEGAARKQDAQIELPFAPPPLPQKEDDSERG